MGPLVAVDWMIAAGFPSGIDFAFVTEQSVTVRVITGFLAVLAFGSAFRYWQPARVHDAIEDLFAHPVSAIAFGVVTHLIIAFGIVYLSYRLVGIEVLGFDVSGIGVVFGAVALLAVGAFGFLVVGGTIVELWGGRPGVNAVVIGAFLAGASVSPDPAVSVLIWVGIVSIGIGGAVHEWFNASAMDDHAG